MCIYNNLKDIKANAITVCKFTIIQHYMVGIVAGFSGVA